MNNLIKADFYKALKSKALYICTGVCIFLGLFTLITMKVLFNRLADNPDFGGDFGGIGSEASGLWAMVFALANGFVEVFAGVFAAIFISSEFQHGTMKNMLSKGADRTKVFFSKFIVVACVSLAMMILFMLTTFVAGTAMWGTAGSADAGKMAGMILTEMLLIISYAAFFTFIAVTLRSMGASLATSIVSVFLVASLLGLVNNLFNITINGTALNFADYWIGGAMSNLATLTPTIKNIVTGIIVGLAWGAASITGGLIHFRKVDIK